MIDERSNHSKDLSKSLVLKIDLGEAYFPIYDILRIALHQF